jgi:hypothetical protein
MSSDGEGHAGRTDLDPGEVRRVLQWAALGALCLLAGVALLRFYLGASTAVDQWAAPRYRAALQAAFNLVVLLASSAGVAVLLRRLDRSVER